MASDESDDEPLSVLAAAKKVDPQKFQCEIIPVEQKSKKRNSSSKKTSLTIKINRRLKTVTAPPVIDRPADVWLYLKDLNPTGPYKCLLCADWFINRSKMVVHYVLNHKKDFCGICRYFVNDRENWVSHVKFHEPWPCSQCVETFPSEISLRQHLSSVHNLVHCRLCHFRLPVGEQYEAHLGQKHNVSNMDCKDNECFWEIEDEDLPKFNCYLCSKENNLSSTFFPHYMGFHHFTLKCITSFISGTDPPFAVHGAEISTQFVDGQLKDLNAFGYVDLEHKPGDSILENLQIDLKNQFDLNNQSDPNNQPYRGNQTVLNGPRNTVVDFKNETTEGEILKDMEELPKKVENLADIEAYEGDDDFDVTLTELIILQKCYFEYVKKILNDISQNLVPVVSDVNNRNDVVLNVKCPLCDSKFYTGQLFMSHMYKMHNVKSIPSYSCRVCGTTFDNHNELDSHMVDEINNFENLWICQFCDKEFSNRENVRKHLSDHWEAIEYDNCFSPHLGFRCKYCPTLFWNETDRERHQVRVHFNKYTDQFYKCVSCSVTFSDKVWYIHHYLENHLNGQKMGSYLLKCCVCCIVLSNIDEMRSHFVQQHPEARKVYCSIDPCKYKPLMQRKSLKMHVKAVHTVVRGGPEKPVACPVCTREFPSVRSLNSHVTQVHGPGKFKCKLCKAMLHTLDERKLHYLLIHPGRHPFECSECGKSFQYKSSLYMHKQDHLPNKQNYTCNYCNKEFAKKDSFREHLQIHEGPRHACSYCPMRFVQRSNMLRHERRHTGERPYACPHCSRTFADKGACTSHARTHSKESSYACLYCGQTFVQKSKLTYHIRKHTGENLETCSICSKLFTSACALREHMKIHLCKKESVKCPLCDKKYQDERYMLRHLRTSHTRTQFTCPICQKVVTSAVGLRHHVITHSPLNTFRCRVCPKSYAVKRTIVKHLLRRHSLNSSEVNLKDYYTRLEPRQCKLDLDEETMTRVFGPPKKRPDVLITDFVTYTRDKNQKKKTTSEPSEKESDSNTDNDNEDSHKAAEVKIKEEYPDDMDQDFTANDLEPTDFVSVKIEPMEDEDAA